MKLSPSLFFNSLATTSVFRTGYQLTVNMTGPHSVSADDFKVTAIITNNAEQSITLLNHPTSIVTQQWKTDLFGIISESGESARFSGVQVKWSPKAALQENDFTVLGSGESIEVEHNLSGIYDFTEAGEGYYKIEPHTQFQMVSSTGQLSTLVVDVFPHYVKVSGHLAAAKAPVTRRFANYPTYSGCSASQTSDVAASVPHAEQYINDAVTYLGNIKDDSTRYQTWFGAWDKGRKDTVLSHFTKMTGDPSRTTYDCGTCPGGPHANAFAYVYPNQPNYVYLCNAFWRAPTTGTDSKAGTIVHEQSHFTENGGTKDYVYGQAGAQQLARTNPDLAIMNADSTEYFAENNPTLP